MPESISQLVNLRELVLSHNRFHHLPAELYSLSQLQTLLVNNNAIFHTLYSNIMGLHNIVTLSFKSNNLSVIPDQVGKLEKLQDLDFSYNQIPQLPHALSTLTTLQKLNLQGNVLMTIPHWLGNFTQLKVLFLRENALLELPSEIGQLTQLQLLELGRNNLTALPAELFRLTELVSLNIQHNHLSSLQSLAEIGHLVNLTRFCYQDNKAVALPDVSLLKVSFTENFDKLSFRIRESQNIIQKIRLIIIANHNSNSYFNQCRYNSYFLVDY
jgi:leucine-rich repeat protein SHOC2